MKKAKKWNGKKRRTISRRTSGRGSNGVESVAEELLRRDFPLHCKRLRLGMGLTQKQFAVRLGYKNLDGFVTVSRLETGAHSPQIKFLKNFMQLQNQYDNQV